MQQQSRPAPTVKTGQVSEEGHCVMSGKGGKDSHVHDMPAFTSAEDSGQLYDCRVSRASV